MNCRMIQDRLPELALDSTVTVAPELQAHLNGCPECAGALSALRATMNLLDEWKAPEPSPFWDVRMQALLREEQRKAAVPAGFLQWFRRPALSLAAALSLVIGVGLYRVSELMQQTGSIDTAIVQHIPAPTGTAVADLNYLDKNSDMLQNFDALDALDGDDEGESSN